MVMMRMTMITTVIPIEAVETIAEEMMMREAEVVEISHLGEYVPVLSWRAPTFV